MDVASYVNSRGEKFQEWWTKYFHKTTAGLEAAASAWDEAHKVRDEESKEESNG
jgi:hypothetical protein